MSRIRRLDLGLGSASLAWLLLLAALPALQERKESFALTLVLLASNFLASIWVFSRVRRVLVAVNCVQLALFGVTSALLASAFGEGHYAYQHVPALYDWTEFTVAHVLRAADLLDVLDEYGVHLQAIHQESTSAGLILVCLHINADLFLLGLLSRRLRALWHKYAAFRGSALQRGRRGALVVIVCCILMSAYLPWALVQGWREHDLYRWPLDNVLRLLDLGDVMQIFQVRLHRVEMDFWLSAYALAFRCAAGLCLARLTPWVRLCGLKEHWYTVEELIEFLQADEVALRASAAAALGKLGPGAAAAVPALRRALSRDLYALVRRRAAVALGRIAPAAAPARPALRQALRRSEPALRRAAARALDRIGPATRAASTTVRGSAGESGLVKC
jgi:hypothetical protein